jgi:phosphohistidine swiveling domain-containing protein
MAIEAQSILEDLPPMRQVARGVGEYVYAQTSQVPGTLDPEQRDHPFRTYRIDPDNFRVRPGRVFLGSVSVKAVKFDFKDPGPKEEHFVWCKITLDAGSGAPTAAVIEEGATIPSNTSTLLHWPIVDLYNVHEGGDAYLGVNQIVSEHIRLPEVRPHPFQIITTSGKDPKFKIFLRSSIINGTNGGPFNFTNLNQDISVSSEKFIIAEAEVTKDPFKISDSGFTIRAVGSSDTDEVKFADDNESQTKIRLLIGKVTVADEMDSAGKVIGKALIPWQAVVTSFKAVVAFHNGLPVYVLQSAATHQSSI